MRPAMSDEQQTANRIADWIGDFAFAHGDDSFLNVIYKMEEALRNGEWKQPLPRDPLTGEPMPRET